MTRLSIVTLALAAIALLWALSIDANHAWQACEALHSVSTCQHILR